MTAGAGVAGRMAAVVVNHDAGDALLACVASLRAGGIEEIVVVDNASADGSLARLAAVDPNVVLVPTGANLGYGRAANRGVARATAEVVLVCNPDLLSDHDAPAALLATLDAHRDCAVAGPLVCDPSGAIYPSARAFPSLGVAIGHAFVGLLTRDNPWTRRYRREADVLGVAAARRAGTLEQAGELVDWVSGACMAVRRCAFTSLGGFDEGYFMYVEDLDLCWRLGRAGWAVRYVPGARVVHHQGLSARRRPYAMLVAHHRSTWRFVRTSTTGWTRALLPLVALGLGVRLAVALAKQAAADAPVRSRRPADVD